MQYKWAKSPWHFSCSISAIVCWLQPLLNIFCQIHSHLSKWVDFMTPVQWTHQVQKYMKRLFVVECKKCLLTLRYISAKQKPYFLVRYRLLMVVWLINNIGFPSQCVIIVSLSWMVFTGKFSLEQWSRMCFIQVKIKLLIFSKSCYPIM